MRRAGDFYRNRDRTVTGAANRLRAVVISVSVGGPAEAQIQYRSLNVVRIEPATELTMMTARESTGQKDMYQPFRRETNGPTTAAAIAAPMPPHTTG